METGHVIVQKEFIIPERQHLKIIPDKRIDLIANICFSLFELTNTVDLGVQIRFSCFTSSTNVLRSKLNQVKLGYRQLRCKNNSFGKNEHIPYWIY